MKKSVKEQFLTDFFACLLFFKLFFRRGEEIGYCARLDGEYTEIFRPCIPQTLHSTGDVFASALCGALMNGKTMPCALEDAAKFCDDCVQKTVKRGEAHWYSLAFEDVLKEERER